MTADVTAETTADEAWGEPRYRGLQVFRWIHNRGVFDPAQMTDLPKSLRARLAEERLEPSLTIDSTHLSEDGTRKLLVKFADDRTAVIERERA